jgi:hypothetical protein
MDIYSECKRLLETNDYEVVPSPTALDQFRFEDESLMGLVWVVAKPSEIVADWKSKQDRFLKDNAGQLRKAEDKGWNVYIVLLAEAAPELDEKARLAEIEEDFRSARKIAQADIKTRVDLERALYPLLPIQNLISSQKESHALVALDSKISQANLQSSARVLLDVDLTDQSLSNFIAAHETERN